MRDQVSMLAPDLGGGRIPAQGRSATELHDACTNRHDTQYALTCRLPKVSSFVCSIERFSMFSSSYSMPSGSLRILHHLTSTTLPQARPCNPSPQPANSIHKSYSRISPSSRSSSSHLPCSGLRALDGTLILSPSAVHRTSPH